MGVVCKTCYPVQHQPWCPMQQWQWQRPVATGSVLRRCNEHCNAECLALHLVVAQSHSSGRLQHNSADAGKCMWVPCCSVFLYCFGKRSECTSSPGACDRMCSVQSMTHECDCLPLSVRQPSPHTQSSTACRTATYACRRLCILPSSLSLCGCDAAIIVDRKRQVLQCVAELRCTWRAHTHQDQTH